MRLGVNLVFALRSLRDGWTRAILSALGVTVGASAIALLVSIALGVREDVESQVRDLGVNVLVVVPGRLDSGTFNPNFGGASYLSEADAKSLSKLPGVVRAEPFSFVGGGIRVDEKTAAPFLAACTPGWFAMRPVVLREGRTFREGEGDVTVLGSLAADSLFENASALGKKVTINGRSYAVVGVTQDKKQEGSLLSFGSLQNLVYVPYERLKKVQPNLQTDRIMIQARPEAEPKALIKRCEAVLGKRLDKAQFQVLTQEDLLGLIYKLMGILTWLLTGLTSIALFVGGVGIMTVMLMSVNERAKEIGVRKTVGARSQDIFLQFLFEALLLASCGGVAGLLLTVGVDKALDAYTPIHPKITLGVVALSLLTSLGVGGLFGVLPAMKAARKDPVAALRSE
ncbi:ABC transporter permease [bacterium]|nr:MAG: ABC transporter permease [bacterium]